MARLLLPCCSADRLLLAFSLCYFGLGESQALSLATSRGQEEQVTKSTFSFSPSLQISSTVVFTQCRTVGTGPHVSSRGGLRTKKRKEQRSEKRRKVRVLSSLSLSLSAACTRTLPSLSSPQQEHAAKATHVTASDSTKPGEKDRDRKCGKRQLQKWMA